MLVHPVVIPGPGTRSWAVLGDDDVPVVPVDRFLAYLTDIGRSPNTVKAYSYDLKDYWEFLSSRSLDWREARLEDVGEFVAWLQLPPAGRLGQVAVLPSVAAGVTAATVNRKLIRCAGSTTSTGMMASREQSLGYVDCGKVVAARRAPAAAAVRCWRPAAIRRWRRLSGCLVVGLGRGDNTDGREVGPVPADVPGEQPVACDGGVGADVEVRHR
jgi:hypothetical protein